MRVYLSGPVSGIPAEEAGARFGAWAARLRALPGVESVFVPTEELPHDMDHRAAMRACLTELASEDGRGGARYGALAMLPWWEWSPGSRAERTVADACGVRIVYLSSSMDDDELAEALGLS